MQAARTAIRNGHTGAHAHRIYTRRSRPDQVYASPTARLRLQPTRHKALPVPRAPVDRPRTNPSSQPYTNHPDHCAGFSANCPPKMRAILLQTLYIGSPTHWPFSATLKLFLPPPLCAERGALGAPRSVSFLERQSGLPSHRSRPVAYRSFALMPQAAIISVRPGLLQGEPQTLWPDQRPTTGGNAQATH